MTNNHCKKIFSASRIAPRGFLVFAAIAAALAFFPSALRAGTLSTDVIGMFPQNVGEFAYVDLRQARALPWFPQLEQQMLPARFRDFEKFLTSAGIDPNVQVEEVAWALVSDASTGNSRNAVPSAEDVVGVALGNFRPDTTEAFFQAQKVPSTKVHNISLYSMGSGTGAADLAFCFIDNSTAAFGQRRQLERLIAVRYGEAPSLLTNSGLSPLITGANGNGVVWVALDAEYARLAMQQLVPQASQFPQAGTLIAGLRAMTIQISAGSRVQAHFEAICASPDAANTFAAVLQAGVMYQRYQIANSNPDLASLLDAASIAPAGERLEVRLALTNDQVVGLIQRNTFAMGF